MRPRLFLLHNIGGMKKTYYAIILLIFCTLGTDILAQGVPSGGGGGGATRNEEDFKFMPIPYIDYNRSLGFTLGALPLCMYNISKKDTVSPSSLSGAIGMYTTTQTWFVAQFNMLYLKEDRYRVQLFAGHGNINFQTFVEIPGNPGYINYNTIATFFQIEVQRKIYKQLYLGVNYSYSHFTTTFEIGPNPQQVDELQGLGLVGSFDHRDNVYYPHKGYIGNVNFSGFPEFLGNKSVNQKLEVDYNHFFEMKNEKDIIGARMYFGMGIGDLTFNQQFIVGQTDIRGYSLGKFRGNQVLAVQSEYRYNPWKKLGFVGFVGVATVFEDDEWLPGAGVGFRYMVFEKNHMNVGMDAAIGKDDWGLYFRVGEAF